MSSHAHLNAYQKIRIVFSTSKKCLATALLPFFALFTIGISTAQALAPVPDTEYRVDDGRNDPFNAFAVDTTGNVTFCGAGDNNATTSVPYSYLVPRFADDGSLLWKDYYRTGQGSWFGPSCDMTVDGLGNSYVVLSESYAYGRLLKYDAAGNRTVISIGGTIGSEGGRIYVATDAANNVYVFGKFIEKYDVNGNRLWHTGFITYGSIKYIAVDGAGNIYATGSTGSSITTAKYAPNGTMLWARNQTATNYLSVVALEIAPDGNVVLAGSVYGTNYISLWKYDTTGNLLWARYPDYGISASLSDMDIDSVGNIIASAALGADLLIAKYDSSGNPTWSQVLDTGISEVPRDLAIGHNDSIYVNGNGFVVKYDSAGNHLWTMAAGLSAVAMKVTDDGRLYLGGYGYVTNVDALVVKYLDRPSQPPAISVNQTPLANAYGWNNTNVTVSFTATDDDSTPTCTVNSVTLTAEAVGQVVNTTCTDAARNSASASHTVNIDKTAPGLVMPSFAASYMLNNSVSISFSAIETLSQLASMSATLNGNPVSSGDAVTLTQVGINTFSLTATDRAGNTETQSMQFTVIADTTPPVISVSRLPLATANGWNNSDVTVTFTATDDYSIPTCSVNSVTLTEGFAQTVSTTCTDAAGNSSSATVTDINIDKTAPVLDMPSLVSSYGLNSSITLTFGASDALSGLTTQSATLNGNPISSGSTVVLTQLGANTFTLTATDQAGNSISEMRQFTVNYAFGGFLSPLGNNRTTFHLGSVIPVKFDLYDASGAAISAAIAQLSLQQLSDGEPVGDPIDASPTSGADSGNLFRYSGGHYMYNLSTKPFSAGIWRIQATLDDGSVHTIEVGLTSK